MKVHNIHHIPHIEKRRPLQSSYNEILGSNPMVRSMEYDDTILPLKLN
jgi:hypothetical protein